MGPGQQLGLPVQEEKFETEGTPCEEGVFLGIEIDTKRMILRRLVQIAAEVMRWRNKTSASGRQVASLVGLLAFAARVVAPGRLYTSRLISALCVSGSTAADLYRRRAPLSDGFRADLNWWEKFYLLEWNRCHPRAQADDRGCCTALD